ncbi:MAG: hypothetical protein KDA96_25455, partial [Planctomycetaceae bacterium]|nr:hypothetical protein [Planctomycetaceae bacterium]
PVEPPQENQSTTYNFEIRNTGRASADNVKLIVTIDTGLRHKQREPFDPDREVESNRLRIPAGQSATVPLSVIPTSRGVFFCTVELRHNDAQLELIPFEITATAAPAPSGSNP